MAKKKAKRSKAAGKAAKRGKSKTARPSARKSKSAKRTLIAPRGDKRYVRRSKKGRFTQSDDVGRSLSTDRRRKAKKKSRAGQGDRGDR